jgi:hypothetical protein
VRLSSGFGSIYHGIVVIANYHETPDGLKREWLRKCACRKSAHIDDNGMRHPMSIIISARSEVYSALLYLFDHVFALNFINVYNIS